MAKPLSCPSLSVCPVRSMVDERFDVRVQGLLPGVRVTLHAQLQSEDGDFWEGFGHYVSDDSGTVTGALKKKKKNLFQVIRPCVQQVRSNTPFAVFQYLKMPVLVDRIRELSPWVCCGV